jgi:hypothetical protein
VKANQCPLWVESGHSASAAELFENGAMLASGHREHATRDRDSQRTRHIDTNAKWLAIITFVNRSAMRGAECRFHVRPSKKYQGTGDVRRVYRIILALVSDVSAGKKRSKRLPQDFTARHLEWLVMNRTQAKRFGRTRRVCGAGCDADQSRYEECTNKSENGFHWSSPPRPDINGRLPPLDKS